MYFLLSSMSVVYVLTTPIPEKGENATVDQIRRRNKWDNDDYVCRGLILKGMFDPLFDIYQNLESGKELWIPWRPNIWLRMHQVRSYFHLRIEESLMAQDSDKLKGNNVVGPQFFIIEPNDSVVINSIIESSDAIFDENRFSSVPRPSLKIPNGTEYIGGSVVPEEDTEEEKRMKSLTNTPIDIYWLSFSVVGKLSKLYDNPGISTLTKQLAELKISNSEDNSSTSGWVFLLGGGAISWASKKQTCITGSTMESELWL
ncbi:hypothetical protein Tco_0300815 [Tanacetum coccineum]